MVRINCAVIGQTVAELADLKGVVYKLVCVCAELEATDWSSIGSLRSEVIGDRSSVYAVVVCQCLQ